MAANGSRFWMAETNGQERKPEPPDKPPAPPQVPRWALFLWMVAAVFLVFFWFYAGEPSDARELPYSEFKAAVAQGHVDEVTLRGEEIRGRLTPEGVGVWGGADEHERFTTTRPPVEDPRLLDRLEEAGVTVTAEPAERAWWQEMLIGVLPWVLLLGLFLWLLLFMQRRMMQSGGPGGMFNFGQSKARRFREDSPRVTMDEVAGVEGAKRDLREIVDYLRNPEKYRALGAKLPKGVLMVGPPGTGKTLIARAVAGEAGVPFYSISGSEFIEMFVGVGASRVRDLFQNARKEAPALIFIDEIDSIGRSRGAGLGGGHDEREQTLNQILNEMDGFETHEPVVVLAATNRPDVLDAALLRPGRFDRKVILERPGKEAREAILKVHARKVPLAEDVDLAEVAQRTIGFSGADLENLVNEAALNAARQSLERVDRRCFDQARDKLVLGDKRDARMTEEEKQRVAYHEGGHALLAYLLPHADPLDKVSIIPRGMALGVTEQTPREERYNLHESYLKDRIAVMLGGRVAEKTVFGEVSSGAENDLKEATRLARRMVAQWGMSEGLGPIGVSTGEEHVFLGREMTQPKEYSESLAERIDAEVRELLLEREATARKIVQTHRAGLDRLAEALLAQETLDAEAIGGILSETPGEQPDAATR